MLSMAPIDMLSQFHTLRWASTDFCMIVAICRLLCTSTSWRCSRSALSNLLCNVRCSRCRICVHLSGPRPVEIGDAYLYLVRGRLDDMAGSLTMCYVGSKLCLLQCYFMCAHFDLIPQRLTKVRELSFRIFERDVGWPAPCKVTCHVEADTEKGGGGCKEHATSCRMACHKKGTYISTSRVSQYTPKGRKWGHVSGDFCLFFKGASLVSYDYLVYLVYLEVSRLL